MSIETRIQAINDHLIDDYKVLRLAGADLSGVNKNIVNLKMSWKERLLYFMNNGTQDVWNNWDKVNGTGTTLSLNNTEEAPMSLTYKGNTSQNGTPTPSSPIPVQVVSGDNSIEVVGKNIWNEQWENGYYNRITGTKGTGDTYIRSADYISVNPNSTIYFNKPSEFTNYAVIFYDSTKTITGTIPAPARTLSAEIGVPSTASYFTFYGDTGVANATYKNNVIITYGNSSTTYEPYKSASYPISLGDKELCKIGTYQDKIDKSSGKNLINLENFLANATGVVKNTDGSYTFTSTITMYNTTTPLEKIVNDSVTITYKIKNGTGTNFRIRWVYEDGYIQDTPGNGTGTSEVTLTATSQELSVHGKVVGITANFSSGGTFTIRDFMINEGTTALPYEPYGTGWYLKKEIGKVVLDENNIGFYKGSNYSQIYSQELDVDKYQSQTTAFSNRFIYAYNNNYGSFFVNTTKRINFLVDTSITTLEQAKTWVSNNEVEAYYILATPTYETITDTTLIEQLEALKKSYESVTNISQVNNDLPFELSVTALEVMS